MARKSGWQSFADNFNSVYGTFSKAAQDFESADIMDDEKFMAEGGLGYDSKAGKPLEGTALEKARYKALGNIATKYGNAKEGLGYRQQLSNLESSERENMINQSIMAELINQRGALTSGQMRSQINANDASASLSYARGNEITKLLGPKLDKAKALARSAGFEADVAGVNAYLAQNTESKTLAKQLAELETQIAQQENQLLAAGDPSAAAALIAGQQKNEAQSTTAALIADSKYSWLAPIAQNKADYLQANNDASTSNLKFIADSAELKKLAQQHRTETSAARRDEMKLSALFQYQKGIQSGKYGTGENFNNEEATNDFLQLTAAFEGQPAAAALYNKYVKDGNEAELAKVVQTGMVFGAKVKSALQKPDGVFKVVELFDLENGGAFGMRLDTQHPEGPRIVETNEDGSDFRVVAQGATMTALGENLQALTGPSAMIGLADQMALRKKEGLDTQVTDQQIKTANSQVGVNEATVLRINELVKGMEGERELNAEQVKLVEQQTKKIVAELDLNRGLTKSGKQKQLFDQTAKFIGQYLLTQDPTGEGLDDALQAFKKSLLGQGGDGWRVQPAAKQ